MLTIAEIAQAVAIIAACWAIVSGVGAWKREFLGKRQIELAEEVLATFFEVKDSIAFIRSPFASTNEGKSRKRAEGESAVDAELLDRGYIVIERYTQREAAFARFNTLKYKFMASFGKGTEPIFLETNAVLHSIFVSARMLATHYWRRQGRVPMAADEFQRHLDEMHRHEGIFWDTTADDDEIRKKLEDIQKRLEAATAHCFEEPMKTYSWLTWKPW